MVGIHEIPLLRIAVFAGIRGFGKEVKGFVEDNVMKCHLGAWVRTEELCLRTKLGNAADFEFWD